MSDLFEFLPPERDREGKTFERQFDYARLNGQARAVWDVVKDGRWRSLAEIANSAGSSDHLFVCEPSLAGRGRGGVDLIDRLRDREASVSARLRDFRKLGLRVDRKRIKGGLFYYRVIAANASGGDGCETTKDQHG